VVDLDTTALASGKESTSQVARLTITKDEIRALVEDPYVDFLIERQARDHVKKTLRVAWVIAGGFIAVVGLQYKSTSDALDKISAAVEKQANIVATKAAEVQKQATEVQRQAADVTKQRQDVENDAREIQAHLKTSQNVSGRIEALNQTGQKSLSGITVKSREADERLQESQKLSGMWTLK